MPQQDSDGHRRAFLVATSKYRDSTLQALRAPGRDAVNLARVLRDPEIGCFEVKTLTNAPVGRLRRNIESFCKAAAPTDLLLMYLSCHGLLDDRGRLYYAAIDTDRSLLSSTALSAEFLNDELENSRARRQILLLDCCHSGSFAKGAKGGDAMALQDRFAGGRGRIVLTASRATEYSFEGASVSGEGVRSVFTHAVVDGLSSGAADWDHDGRVTVTDLFKHVYEAVRAVEPRQTPELWTYGAEGDLVIAQNPHGAVVDAIPLPEDLRVALDSPRPAIREQAVREVAALYETGEPGLVETVEQTLHRIVDEDLPRVASVAQAALKEHEPKRGASPVRHKDAKTQPAMARVDHLEPMHEPEHVPRQVAALNKRVAEPSPGESPRHSQRDAQLGGNARSDQKLAGEATRSPKKSRTKAKLSSVLHRDRSVEDVLRQIRRRPKAASNGWGTLLTRVATDETGGGPCRGFFLVTKGGVEFSVPNQSARSFVLNSSELRRVTVSQETLLLEIMVKDQHGRIRLSFGEAADAAKVKEAIENEHL